MRRRAFLALSGGLLGILGGVAAAAPPPARRQRRAVAALAALERHSGGRLGLFARDLAGGGCLAWRADERFPLCSTVKLLIVAALLQRVDQGRERLAQIQPYTAADLLSYAPITRAHLATAPHGGMTLADLAAAALQWSDNTAANLLLRRLGGPAAVTAFSRGLGENVTRLDRWEPDLNSALPGDRRDTSSPRAMADDLETLLLGPVLSTASRRRLLDWMAGDHVGDHRLRAGLPGGWSMADKTGSGENGTANTVGLMMPPGRAPIVAAVYLTQSTLTAADRDGVHREAAALIAGLFT